jgi:hypothetical protein
MLDRMKQQFSNYMLQQDFKSAAELIFEATLKIQVPENINLNINIDRDQNINDLTGQMKNCYDQINEAYSGISFEKMWTNVFNSNELSEKQNLKDNELLVSNAKTAYDEAINLVRKQQYEQIFDGTVLTLKATLQGVVNAAINI